MIRPGAKDGSNDGVGVGLLGVINYRFRHGETTLDLTAAGNPQVAGNGNAGNQYVVRDAPMVAAKAKSRNIAAQTPLNRMGGLDLVPVWLIAPDGATDYFAQVNRSVENRQ